MAGCLLGPTVPVPSQSRLVGIGGPDRSQGSRTVGPTLYGAQDAVKPDLILSTNLGYAVAAHKMTKTIPTVMWVSGFPVEGGVAESLARPGKNVTGLTIYGVAPVHAESRLD